MHRLPACYTVLQALLMLVSSVVVADSGSHENEIGIEPPEGATAALDSTMRSVDTEAEKSFRRKRQNEQLHFLLEGHNAASLVTAAESTIDTAIGSDSLEHLWERESVRAAAEVERMLQGVGSMPLTGAPGSASPLTMAPFPPTSSSFLPTGSPASTTDCLQGRSPEQYLLDEMLLITNVNLLLDPTTPQGNGFNFLLEDTTVRQNLCGYPSIAQRYGLGLCTDVCVRVGALVLFNVSHTARSIFKLAP